MNLCASLTLRKACRRNPRARLLHNVIVADPEVMGKERIDKPVARPLGSANRVEHCGQGPRNRRPRQFLVQLVSLRFGFCVKNHDVPCRIKPDPEEPPRLTSKDAQ
jgi:hypothetical protein